MTVVSIFLITLTVFPSICLSVCLCEFSFCFHYRLQLAYKRTLITMDTATCLFRNIIAMYIFLHHLSRPMGKPTICVSKTKVQISFAGTAKLISAFVFATRIVQFLFYLNPKFQASSLLLKLYKPVCVRPVRKPHCWFFLEVAHLKL